MSALLPILLALPALAAPLTGLLLGDTTARGWRRIASGFAAGRDVDGVTRQDGAVGNTGILQLRGLLRAAATADGLYLAPPRPMRMTHRPLLIPWDQMSVRSEQRRLGVPVLTLSIGRVHLGFVTLRGGVAGDVLERLGGGSADRTSD